MHYRRIIATVVLATMAMALAASGAWAQSVPTSVSGNPPSPLPPDKAELVAYGRDNPSAAARADNPSTFAKPGDTIRDGDKTEKVPGPGRRTLAGYDIKGTATSTNCFWGTWRTGSSSVLWGIFGSYYVYQYTKICDANYNGLIDYRYTHDWTQASGVCGTSQASSSWVVAGGLSNTGLTEHTQAEFVCSYPFGLGSYYHTSWLNARWVFYASWVTNSS